MESRSRFASLWGSSHGVVLPCCDVEGGLKPINMHVFDGMETGVKAMQFLQRAQNIGKVVISQASTLALKQESHYVLSGGILACLLRSFC